MQNRPFEEARAREEAVGRIDIAIEEDVFPRHQHLVEDEDRVVLIEARGERIVEGRAVTRGVELIRGARDQRDAGGRHRGAEDDGEGAILERNPVMGDEVVMRQRRTGGDHLCPRYHDARIGFLFDMDDDIAYILHGTVAVDRRVDDGVVPVKKALLAFGIPAPGIGGIVAIIVGIAAKCAQEAGLVIRRTPHPAKGGALQRHDRLGGFHHVIGGLGSPEKGMRQAFRPGVGFDPNLGSLCMEGVIPQTYRAYRIAERRMLGHVVDPFAFQVDPAPVP